jgi:carboxymethylenebutenolidase
MCDDSTERDMKRLLAEKRLGRREFGGLWVGATAAWLIPGCESDADSSTQSAVTGTTSELVRIDTPDGTADAFFVHPDGGSHPAVLIWPDILGLRDAFKMMATRLAGSGYAVLVINQYYRTAPAPVLSSWEEWMSDAGKQKLQPMLSAITPEGIASDGGAMVDWLGKQSAVDATKKVGTSGYCMGGPFTLRTAASRPERVGAAASFHGASLVTSAPDSPHLLLPELEASLLIAVAENDDMRQPDAKTTLQEAADAAKLSAEIEVYPAQHGWCPPDSLVYDEMQAERAWSRMLALFAAHL